jgi:hypothetical protein
MKEIFSKDVAHMAKLAAKDAKWEYWLKLEIEAYANRQVVAELQAIWELKTEGILDNGDVFMKQEPVQTYLNKRIKELTDQKEGK